MFDLTTMPCPNKDGATHLLVVKDHFTKYTWAKSFLTKDSDKIVDYLVDLFRKEGTPERWHSDNGGEFDGHYFQLAYAKLSKERYKYSLLLWFVDVFLYVVLCIHTTPTFCVVQWKPRALSGRTTKSKMPGVGGTNKQNAENTCVQEDGAGWIRPT